MKPSESSDGLSSRSRTRAEHSLELCIEASRRFHKGFTRVSRVVSCLLRFRGLSRIRSAEYPPPNCAAVATTDFAADQLLTVEIGFSTGPRTGHHRLDTKPRPDKYHRQDHQPTDNKTADCNDQDIRWLKTEGGIDAVRLPVGLRGSTGFSPKPVESVSSGLIVAIWSRDARLQAGSRVSPNGSGPELEDFWMGGYLSLQL